ncbi:unnamed protein product [Symbiodinium microadriaticum]|nr:unnamed protein product [Symbiodinium microadriaticum]
MTEFRLTAIPDVTIDSGGWLLELFFVEHEFEDKQCNLNISAKGLEVKVDPLQQRIQAAEADETRQEGERRLKCPKFGIAGAMFRAITNFAASHTGSPCSRTMPPDGADRRLSVLAAILSVLTVALASVGGYEGYIFFLERSTYQNQVLGLCFDGRRVGESLDDAKFTVRPGPWSLRQNQRGPPDPQLLCDIPVYAYECPQWATARECGHLHAEEMREVALLRTAKSGVFCFGSLGWFSWDQEGCDADIWTCSFGPCNGYKKSERVCAATLSESYICYFDPGRPGVGERETAFDYPLFRGVAMAALSVLTLAAGISACYFGATRVVPLLCSFGWTPLIVLAAIVMSAGIGFLMEAAMIVLLPGVTPYSLVGGPRFPEARHVTVADLGGAWKSEEPVPPGFNQPSLWVLIEVAMTEVLMIFAFTFAALIPPIVFIVRHRNDRARAAGALNRRLLPDPMLTGSQTP